MPVEVVLFTLFGLLDGRYGKKRRNKDFYDWWLTNIDLKYFQASNLQGKLFGFEGFDWYVMMLLCLVVGDDDVIVGVGGEENELTTTPIQRGVLILNGIASPVVVVVDVEVVFLLF